MPTSVKMMEADKKALDRLQADLRRRGRKLSQQELLGQLVRIGRRHVDEMQDDYPPWTEEEWARVRALAVDTGVVTREEDIDRDVYGARLH